MAPNLFVKATFVRGDFDNIKSESEEKSLVRTDFILQNIFAHLIKDECKFDPIHSINDKEELVFCEMKEVVDSFKLNFDCQIKSLCSNVEITENTVGSVLMGVASELFGEGITWSRIVSLFVFVGEITQQCLFKGHNRRIVDVIYGSFCRLVKEELKFWIDDHGTWEGIRSLSKRSSSNEHLVDFAHSSGLEWAKSIFQGTVRVLGNLASIANQPF